MPSYTTHVVATQALSAVRRAAKHGDRTRDPSAELRVLLEKAEDLGRMLAG